PAAPRSCELLVLSAKTPSALDSVADNLAAYLSSDADADLARVAWTLQTGRKRFAHRRTLVCATREEAISSLTAPSRREAATAGSSGPPSVAFLFPGQGSQHPAMAREVFETEPLFRELVEHGCDQLDSELRKDVREAICSTRGDAG